jgi:mono/diheme cytochrome c family protein
MIRICAVMAFAMISLIDSPGLFAADSPTFSKVIGPLLANRCTSCHGPDRQKKGLRLDSAEGVKKGSESGAVFVAGDPAKSEIYRRTTLPNGDGDRMPAKGEMLTKKQTDDIRAWIMAGAKFD